LCNAEYGKKDKQDVKVIEEQVLSADLTRFAH